MDEKLSILGINVDKVTMAQAMEKFAGFMQGSKLSLIVTPNSEILAVADKDPKLKAVINSADLVIPDGIGLVYASKFLGSTLAERVTGIDFAFNALKWCSENGKKVFFLGAKPGIAEAAAVKLTEQIPGLNIAGCHDGYFKETAEAEVAKQIAESGAEFLCVALGSPKQELFIENHKAELCNIKAAVGIGGSLDVWSGTLKRAPKLFRKLGLEWLYRIIQEPKRLKRSGKLPLFLIKVITSNKEKK